MVYMFMPRKELNRLGELIYVNNAISSAYFNYEYLIMTIMLQINIL